MRFGRPPLRAKLLATFVSLVGLGSLAGVAGLFEMRQLADLFRREEAALSLHAEVQDFRLGLTDLVVGAQRVALTGDRQEAEQLQHQFAVELRRAERCDSCHLNESKGPSLRTRLTRSLGRVPALLSNSGANLGVLVAELERLREDTSTMDQKFVADTALHRQGVETALRDSAQRLLAFVIAAMGLAAGAALLAAHLLSGPLLRLVAAAQRVGRGDLNVRVELPSDPDLANLTAQFNTMVAKVSERVRETARAQLLDRTLASQEDERKRIARELHDHVGQSLSALLMGLRVQPVLGAEALTSLELKLGALIDEVRDLAWSLRPEVLSDHGLHAALERAVQDARRRSDATIACQCAGQDDASKRLPENLELVLFRVAQEALNNATVHARARNISVVLILESTQATLLVEDDGVGFDADAKRADGGRNSLGLLGMEERVALAGGELTITSSPGAGCAVRAQVPLPKEAACPSES